MRIITFRFDDGLWEGAQKAIRILGENHASFFIVKNWLADYNLPIVDEYNKGHYHGSIQEWKEVSLLGHDVQAHGCSHSGFSNLTIEQRTTELSESIELLQEIHPTPFVMCYPYNDMTPDDLIKIGYDAAGFETTSSDEQILYNKINDYNPFALKSWAIRERHFDRIKIQLEKLPENSWTILALHSLDAEGWEPWSQYSFSTLVEYIISNNFKILSLAECLSNTERKIS